VRQDGHTKEYLLKRLGGGCFVSAHLPFSEEGWMKLQTMGYKQILMLRDPRDIVVSRFHFVLKRPIARLHPYLTALPDDESRIMSIIQGIADHEMPGGIGLPDIGRQCTQYFEWVRHGSHVVRFENLVGEAGGGSIDLQLAEVEALATYVGISLSKHQVKSIAQQAFYRNSNTFRKGAIGDWKNFFSDAHKAAFKKFAGQMLIDLGYERDLNW
jgi:hypothetical protein